MPSFASARLACAYFFLGPGLVYGLMASRLPALKIQTGANEAEIGFALMSFGLFGLAGLFSGRWLLARFGSRPVLRLSSLVMMLVLPLLALAPSPLALGLLVSLVGFSMSLTDVAMNTQAVVLERSFERRSMSGLHACYSLGGLLGSLAGALFAAQEAGPLFNFIALMLLYWLPRFWALPRLLADEAKNEASRPRAGGRRPLPLFVLVCGLLALCVYAAEGSAGEWGSLLLYTVKGAEESVAALVFGFFSVAMVSGRLAGDWLRMRWGDFRLLFGGSLLGFLGLSAALWADSPLICLLGYTVMGLGLAPVAPIVFSQAGSRPEVSAAEAASLVSILGYSGLLFIPPLLGSLALRFGLDRALCFVLGLCAAIAVVSLFLKNKLR